MYHIVIKLPNTVRMQGYHSHTLFLKSFIYFIIIIEGVYDICMHACTMEDIWRPEDNLVELVLFLQLLWVLEIEHRSSNLHCQAVSPSTMEPNWD